jgi:5-amino-6-(5-phosphoribosylamino)uracil reductase
VTTGQGEIPYVTLSSAMSIDGYLDSASPPRLALSNAADLDRVDELRAAHDAILVGAGTVRKDDPRLLVRSEALREVRESSGRPRLPCKVTVTATGDLDPRSEFFTAGEARRLVYCPSRTRASLQGSLGALATVVGLGERVTVGLLLRDLGERGVHSVMVEGGSTVHTQFLASGLVDELQLVVAPFFVGDARAPRLVLDGRFPWTAEHRALLLDVRPIGDVVLLRYGLSERCARGPAASFAAARLAAEHPSGDDA